MKLSVVGAIFNSHRFNERLPRFGVPNTNRLVLRGGHDTQAFRTEHGASDCIVVTEWRTDRFAGRRVPDLRRSIGRCRDDALPVCAELDTADVSVMRERD